MSAAPLVLVLEASVRLALAGAFSPSPMAPERAWCGTAAVLTRDTVSVVAIRPARAHHASPLGVSFDCEPGEIGIHSHTGARCDVVAWYCFFPAEPIPCEPSDADRLALAADGAEAGVLVCRDGTALAYRPTEVTP